MQLIRQFELKSEEMYKMAGKIRGFFHAYIGQEAIAAGCMTATQHDDPFITAYRDHGLALAKGVSADSCMAELYGKATGGFPWKKTSYFRRRLLCFGLGDLFCGKREHFSHPCSPKRSFSST